MTKKVAVVTGAGQGMGRAIALKFAANDVHVVLVGRTQEKLIRVADEITALGGTSTLRALDVSNAAQVQQLAASLDGQPVDMLVNCAGEALIKPLEATTVEDWDRILNINLKGPFLLAQNLLPLLRQSDNASIVNIGSKASIGGFPEIAAYTAAKTGLVGLTRSLAAELRPHGIRVVILCPGPADTPMRWAATPDHDPNSLVQPETIAETVWLLVSLPRGVTTSEFLLQSVEYL
jgi:NAD(P)-dependent dehydrogenase (short-subunit alcohol dehydrogenase family)